MWIRSWTVFCFLLLPEFIDFLTTAMQLQTKTDMWQNKEKTINFIQMNTERGLDASDTWSLQKTTYFCLNKTGEIWALINATNLDCNCNKSRLKLKEMSLTSSCTLVYFWAGQSHLFEFQTERIFKGKATLFLS